MDTSLSKRLLVYYQIRTLFPITLFATTVVAIDFGKVIFTESFFLSKHKLFNLIRLEHKVFLSQFSQYTLGSMNERYNSQKLSVLLENRQIGAKMIQL